MVLQSVAENTQLFHFLRNEWTFAPGPTPESCWLGFKVEFSFRSMMYAQATTLFFDEVVGKMVGAFEDRCRTTYRARIATAQRAAAAAASEAVAHLAGADSSQPIVLTATAVPAQAAAPADSRATAAGPTIAIRLERAPSAFPLSAAFVDPAVPAASPTVTMVLPAANPHMVDTDGTGLPPKLGAAAAVSNASGRSIERPVASIARVDAPKPAPVSPQDRPFPSTYAPSPVSIQFPRMRTPGATDDAAAAQYPAAPQQRPKPVAPTLPAGQPPRASAPAVRPPVARASAISTPVSASSGARSFAQSSQSAVWPLRTSRQSQTPRPAPPLPRGLSLW